MRLGLGIGTNKRLLVSGSAPLLLDSYPGAAAAYSLRYISTPFIGNDVILVRRSSDNAELAFTPEEITDGTLTSWVGAGDGFVKTWYDQSGSSRNATNTNNANQPKIVNSGSLILQDSLPALSFNPSAPSYLQTSTFPVEPQPFMFFSVVKNNALSDGSTRILLAGVNATNRIFIRKSVSDPLNIFAGGSLVGGSVTASQILCTSLFKDSPDTNESISWINGSVAHGPGDAGGNSVDGLTIGAEYIFSSGWNGTIQEIVFHPSDQSANRAAIEANINSYYSIY